MNSQNHNTQVQDSMADSELTESFLPDLANSSFDSKYKNRQDWDDQMDSESSQKWIMEEYPEDKIEGTPQK